MPQPRAVLALASATLLCACGGDVGDATFGGHHPSTPVTSAAAGLYLGYYQENSANDTADPVAGALVLNLPATSGAAITGSADYNTQSCQTANALPLTGTRSDLGVLGTFTGTIDTVAESGSFSATLDTTALNFSGTYAVDAGKQAFNPAGCTAYTLAAMGSVELFPAATNYPSSGFTVSYATGTRTVSWAAITSTSKTLVYIADKTAATAGTANPVPWQTLIDPSTSTLSVVVPATVSLVGGRQYYAVVEVADSTRARLAFGSVQFTAP